MLPRNKATTSNKETSAPLACRLVAGRGVACPTCEETSEGGRQCPLPPRMRRAVAGWGVAGRSTRGGVRACERGRTSLREARANHASLTRSAVHVPSRPPAPPPSVVLWLCIAGRVPSAPPPPSVRQLCATVCVVARGLKYAIGCGAGAGKVSPSASPPSSSDSPLGGWGVAGRPESASSRRSSPCRCGARSRRTCPVRSARGPPIDLRYVNIDRGAGAGEASPSASPSSSSSSPLGSGGGVAGCPESAGSRRSSPCRCAGAPG